MCERALAPHPVPMGQVEQTDRLAALSKLGTCTDLVHVLKILPTFEDCDDRCEDFAVQDAQVSRQMRGEHARSPQ